MIENVTFLRDAAYPFKVVTIDLVKFDHAVNVVEISANESIYPNHLVALVQHRISEMASQETRNSGREKSA